MNSKNFSQSADTYEETSLVQKSASDELFELLSIQENEDVLDLGCGTGHISKNIREITNGRVVGIDAAEGMISEANNNYGHIGINFELRPADHLEYVEQFDVIFCNSSFQWFKPPEQVLRSCYQALRKNGRMGIQAPARKIYSPNFIEAVRNVGTDASTKETFDQFESPWFFCETAKEYANVFIKAGFEIVSARIDKTTTSYTPDEVFDIFDSGAAAGYLNQAYYSVPVTPEYTRTFNRIIKYSFNEQASEKGEVDLTFFRIYLVAKKP